MPLPTQKRTKSSGKRRASHFALKAVATTTCPKCKKAVRPHRVCTFCGFYRGKQHLKLKTK